MIQFVETMASNMNGMVNGKFRTNHTYENFW